MDNGKNGANIGDDRAGGTSRGSGNPPAVYSIDQSYKSIIEGFVADGFPDAETGETGYLIERVSEYHIHPYLLAAKKCSGENRYGVKLAHDLLEFDRRCQTIAFEYIGIFETQLRAQYGHWMEQEGGEFALYEPDLFINGYRYEQSMKKLSYEVQRKASRNMRFKQSLVDGKAKIQEAIDCMTLGTLSTLYANTKQSENLRKVAASFNQPKKVLINWMGTISAARNCCAHFDRYFIRRQIPQSPKRVAESEMDSQSPMYLIVILEKLLSSPLVFKDPLLHYSSRLSMSIIKELELFLEAHPDTLSCFRLGESWKADLSCPDVLNASILTAHVDTDLKKISIGYIGDERFLGKEFRREGFAVFPKDTSLPTDTAE